MFLQSDYHDFMPPEPQDDEDLSEKTGLSCFFTLVVSQSFSLVKLNLLFLLGCVPVVTIPISLFAMNRAVFRLVQGQPVNCLRDYWETFRRDWKMGYFSFLLTLAPLVCAGGGMRFYLSYTASSALFFLPFLVCSTVFLVTLLSSGYLYGLLDGRRSMKETVRLAVLLGITKPLRAVLAALGCYGLLLLAVLIFPLSGLYLLLLGFSFPCLLGNFYLRTVLRDR